MSDLKAEQKAKVETLAREANAYLIQMSNITGDGISDVKAKACDILLDHRLTQKAKDPKKQEAILNRLHISQPVKRDNIDRNANLPDTVIKGVKKEGPTVKELQEEYGGAGNFYIPEEEHYILEKEEWRYDQFPEFYNGSNVLDFYDPDIERKLDALEKEEAEILRMEAEEGDMMDGVESENSDGITMDELKASLAEVRSKKTILKNRHKLKGKLVTAKDKKVKLNDMLEHFESIGVSVNKESLRSRSKTNTRTIASLENAQERKAKALLGDSDEDAVMPIDDAVIAAAEAETRGRKRKRERSVNPADFAERNDSKSSAGGIKPRRNMTPAQRTVSAKKIIRSMTKDRREGSEPKRLPYKLVPEEQIRLAKKIVRKFKHGINVNEADRHIGTKMPRHLF